jgi:hypothetical protein
MRGLSAEEREMCERHAQECLELVKRSHDPAIRSTFTSMASDWLRLAGEIADQDIENDT